MAKTLLTWAIEEATTRMWADARALGEAVNVGAGRGWPEEHALRVVLELTPPTDGLVAAAYSTVTIGRPPGDAADVQVRVIPKSDSSEPRDFGHALGTAFGVAPACWSS